MCCSLVSRPWQIGSHLRDTFNLCIRCIPDRVQGVVDATANQITGLLATQPLNVSSVKRVSDFDTNESNSSFSSDLPPMRCLRVIPSRNPMTMKGWRPCSPIS